tara:strand:- start:215 stop:715 length:501 start_codon:yes stop_codon:yes gene_type:complete
MSSQYEAYQELLNSKPEGETYYQCIKIYHPDFTKIYYLVANSVDLIATLPDLSVVTFEKSNIVIDSSSTSNDLDQKSSFTLPDVNNILDDEMSRIVVSENMVNPTITYYIYHSDFLDAPVEFVEYDIDTVSQKKGTFTIDSGVPDLNADETGAIFSYSDWPMLRYI